MFFDRIKTPGIAQVTYLIADDGEAAVVAPCRDVDKYLVALRENALTLRYAVETHRQEDFEMTVIDARGPEAFARGHLPGSYSIWLKGLGRYGGWISDQAAICLIVDGPAELVEARLSLARIGRDNFVGALAKGFEAWRDTGLPLEKATS